MRRLAYLGLLIALCGPLEIGTASAQRLEWKLAFGDHDQRYHYFFTALSGYGESCVAAVLVRDDSIKAGGINHWQRFLRTDDGGISWRELDAGLPGRKAQNQGTLYAVQMVDSMTIVAVGDSGLLLRTDDAGGHWSVTTLGANSLIHVNFADANHGIVIAQGYPGVFTTTDGGQHWDSTNLYFSHVGYYWPADGEALGGSRFRVLSYGAGPLYYTEDNWKHVDSSRMVYDTSDLLHVVTDICSDRGDTIIAFGERRLTDSDALSRALVVRSVHGGSTWTESSFPDSNLTSPHALSALDRPFLLAAGRSHITRTPIVAISFDAGLTWMTDTVRVPSLDSNFTYGRGIYVTPSGRAISIFQVAKSYSSGALATATLRSASVQGFERVIRGTRIYPNPASSAIIVRAPTASAPLHISDALGRELLRSALDAAGESRLDISRLPSGIYNVTIDLSRGSVCVGRFIVKR